MKSLNLVKGKFSRLSKRPHSSRYRPPKKNKKKKKQTREIRHFCSFGRLRLERRKPFVHLNCPIDLKLYTTVVSPEVLVKNGLKVQRSVTMNMKIYNS